MKHLNGYNFLLALVFGSMLSVKATGANDFPLSGDSSLWKEIAPFFAPPDSLKGRLGDFRSPLRFYDGTRVKTKDDWQRRREEILERWHGVMGKWPVLLKQQKLIIDSTVQKEGYV